MNGMEVIMKKKSMCRICLLENVRMHVVTNRNLQKVYEKLTDTPFVTEDSRPMLACSFCYTKLKQCWQLQRKCLEAEEMLALILNEEFKDIPFIIQHQTEFLGGFSRTPIELIDIVEVSELESAAIKEELLDESDSQDDIEIIEDLLKEEPEDGSEQEDIPPHSYESDSEYEVPLLKFEVEEEREVPEKKMKSGPAAMRLIFEDTVTDQLKEIGLSDLENICTSTNDEFVSVPNCEEPINVKQSSSNINKIQEDNEIIDLDTYENSAENTCTRDVLIYDSNLICDGDKHYKCYLCLCTFESATDMNQHTCLHTSDKPYKCNECIRRFSTSQDLPRHICKRAEENSFKCNICMRKFNLRIELNRHMMCVHTAKKPNDCVNKSDNLTSRTHTGEKPYKCYLCQQCFTHKRNLIIHTRVHTGEKLYKCDVCQQCFTQKQSLTIHTRVHTGEKPYKCDVCQKCFIRSQSLIEHTREHTGVKPYKCDICQKCFNRQNALKEHTRVHTGEKPYKCDICKKCFNRRDRLIKHTRTRHTAKKPNKCESTINQINNVTTHCVTHTGKKSYICNICPQNFNKPDDLKLHLHVHSGERPNICESTINQINNVTTHTSEKSYICNICPQYFNTPNDLKLHMMRVHCGGKPYKCRVCNSSYDEKSDLVIHMNVHPHPYKCNICQKTFSKQTGLKSHARYIHGIENDFYE